MKPVPSQRTRSRTEIDLAAESVLREPAEIQWPLLTNHFKLKQRSLRSTYQWLLSHSYQLRNVSIVPLVQLTPSLYEGRDGGGSLPRFPFPQPLPGRARCAPTNLNLPSPSSGRIRVRVQSMCHWASGIEFARATSLIRVKTNATKGRIGCVTKGSNWSNGRVARSSLV